MTGPVDGTAIARKADEHLFQGYAESPSAPISIQALNQNTNVFITIGTTIATTSPTVDSTGKSWYYWSKYAKLPGTGAYWKSQGNGQSSTEIRTLISNSTAFTFTGAQMNCTVQNVASRGYAQAALDCGAAAASVNLTAPCSVNITNENTEMNGCYHIGNATSLDDFPFDRSYDFANGLQGVCHDNNNWFFTTSWRNISGQHGRIGKKPVHQNLNDNNFLAYSNPYSPTWKHLGDCDVHDGVVYVPLEKGDGNASYNAIGRFNTSNLNYYPPIEIPLGSPQRSGDIFPWIARNPNDGLWYSSKFNATELYAYSIVGNDIDYIGSVPLTYPVHRVQGGAFSPSGRLYISTDDWVYNYGIRVIEIGGLFANSSQRAVILDWIDLDWTPPGEEIEGITVWDLDQGQAPGVCGQLHVIMIGVEWSSNDDFYFKHVKISPIGTLLERVPNTKSPNP